MSVSPKRQRWWCTICGREVDDAFAGLGDSWLAYCRHGSANPDAPRKLVHVTDSEERATTLREGRLDALALRRAKVKALTAEGREKLSKREARLLADHDG